MPRRRSPLPAVATAMALVAVAASAQDDTRDVVFLRSGKQVRGRLASPFAPGEELIVQGGRRIRLDRADIERTETVAAAIAEFTKRRLALADNARAQQFLIEWADSHQLHALARLQATWLVLANDDPRLHEYLGHRKKGDRWLWEHDGRWYDRDQLPAVLVREPILLRGERFELRTDGDLRAGVAALLDLERLGVWWYDTFGSDLQLDEVLQPIEVFAHRDATDFPKWGFRPVPFYVPPPHGDIGHTFYAGPAPVRPRLLFYTASQGLLYRAMIGSIDSRNDRDRVCPWLEVGLPMLADQSMQGAAGLAGPLAPQAQDLQALQALGRDYQLTHLLHLPMYGGFYLMDDTPTAINWSAAAMLVQYLLEPGNIPDTRAPFLAYVRAALRERKGDSSSLFDATMGRRIEAIEPGFRSWLEKLAGY